MKKEIGKILSDPFTPRLSKLDTLKPIKLIEINSRLALIDEKAQEQKWLKNLTILKNFERKKKIRYQPWSQHSQPRHLLITGQMP